MRTYHVQYFTGPGGDARKAGTPVGATVSASSVESLRGRLGRIERMVGRGEAHAVSVHDVTGGRRENVTARAVGHFPVPVGGSR